jgi:hypothetical protein
MLAPVTLAWLVVTVVSASPTTRLAEAQAAWDELQYDKVLALAPAAAEWQQFSRAQVVQALTLRSLALASVKRDDEARVLFRQLLSLEPGFVLPDQFGPRVRTLVLEAKDAAARAGSPSLTMEGGALVVGGTSLGLVESIQLSWRADGFAGSTTLPAAPRVDPPWPSTGRIEAWGVVLGPGQSVLSTWGSSEKPTVLGDLAVAAPTTPQPTARPLGAAGIAGLVTGGAGLAAVVAGAVLLVNSNRPTQALAGATRDENGRITSLTQREAFALDAAAQGSFELGGALLVVGGLAVAAGATLVVVDRVQVSVSPQGVAVVVPLEADFQVAR